MNSIKSPWTGSPTDTLQYSWHGEPPQGPEIEPVGPSKYEGGVD